MDRWDQNFATRRCNCGEGHLPHSYAIRHIINNVTPHYSYVRVKSLFFCSAAVRLLLASCNLSSLSCAGGGSAVCFRKSDRPVSVVICSSHHTFDGGCERLNSRYRETKSQANSIYFYYYKTWVMPNVTANVPLYRFCDKWHCHSLSLKHRIKHIASSEGFLLFWFSYILLQNISCVNERTMSSLLLPM